MQIYSLHDVAIVLTMLLMDTQPTAAPPIRPTDLAAAMNWSVPYASQLLSGTRKVTIDRALAILDATGVKLGPIQNLTPREIAVLRKVAA